jgi:hypothetical protein
MKILAALRLTEAELEEIKKAIARQPKLAGLSIGNVIRLALARLLKIKLPPLEHGGKREKSLAPTGDKDDRNT